MAFGNKTKSVTVVISDDSKEALAQLDQDIEALVGLVDELVATHTAILAVLRGEIAVLVADAAGVPIDGVKVFNGPGDPEPPTLVEAGVKPKIKNPIVPESMHPREFDSSLESDDRIRQSPFTRAPRNVQIEWLTEVMADGEWYAGVTIAREVANDERHYRYLKHALGGRLREMHEDGIAERRSSHVKGAMFEFRLKPTTTE